jgi:hypothetical protein
LWGQIEIPWEILEKVARWILRPGLALPEIIQRVLPLMGAHRVNQVSLKSMFNVDATNILTVLHNTQEAKCTDPRDRLYAILGVVEDAEDVEIDYSIPVQTVYRNWAERRIRRTGTLDVLGACADSSRSGDLPSWVPDLRRPWGQDKALWVGSTQRDFRSMIKRRMQNSPNLPEASVSEGGPQLRVTGRCLDTITSMGHVGDVVTGLRDPTDIKPRMLAIISNWETCLQGQGFTRSQHLLIFREAVLRQYVEPSHTGELVNDYEAFRRGRYMGHVFDLAAQVAKLRDFERKLSPKIHGCQPFVAKTGKIEILAGNCLARAGDKVWFLRGALTPFILRRGFHGHRVISPCYVASDNYPEPMAGIFIGMKERDSNETITLI